MAGSRGARGAQAGTRKPTNASGSAGRLSRSDGRPRGSAVEKRRTDRDSSAGRCGCAWAGHGAAGTAACCQAGRRRATRHRPRASDGACDSACRGSRACRCDNGRCNAFVTCCARC